MFCFVFVVVVFFVVVFFWWSSVQCFTSSGTCSCRGGRHCLSHTAAYSVHHGHGYKTAYTIMAYVLQTSGSV